MKKYSKITIAEEYLEMATSAYNSGKYFTALHLAAAAEEICEGVIKARNKEEENSVGDDNPFVATTQTTILEDIFARIRNFPAEDFWKSMRHAKNKIKHVVNQSRTGFELEIEVNIERESTFVLARAIHNYRKLGFSPRGQVLDFFLKFNRGDFQHITKQ